jgi:hypothetical protein
VANTLKSLRNGAAGFIAWLDRWRCSSLKIGQPKVYRGVCQRRQPNRGDHVYEGYKTQNAKQRNRFTFACCDEADEDYVRESAHKHDQSDDDEVRPNEIRKTAR